MYNKSKYDKLNELVTGSFYEITWWEAAGDLRTVRTMFIRVVCATWDRDL